MRDWENDGTKVGLKFIRKEGDSIICEREGFIFSVHRSNWAPLKLSPSQCLTPTEYFKYLVKKVHGDIYDLSETIFTGANSKVIARCTKHGSFSIEANNFTTIRGCPHCGNERSGLLSRDDTAGFIEKANKIHENKFDYSLVKYETAKKPVRIICKTHGEFSMLATNHLSGRGCTICGRETSRQSKVLSQKEVIRRFKDVHKEKYDYSSVVYIGDAHSHLNIICKEHGSFYQSYANHNSGKGCPVCAREFSPRLKSGFVKSYDFKGYASLYLINCFNESENFYKIGITTKSLKHRFAGTSLPYKYEVIHVHEGTGNNIWNMEKLLHRKYKNVKYIPLIDFGGMYECFSYIDKVGFLENLSEISSSSSEDGKFNL